MKKISLFSLLLVLVFPMVLANETKVPLQVANIIIDGKSHEVFVGEKSTLKIGDKIHEVVVTLNPFKVFNDAGVKFKFSSTMHFAKDDSDASAIMWSIDGNDSSIMVMGFNSLVGIDDFLAIMQDQYTQMKAKVIVEDIVLKTTHQDLMGKNLHIKLGSISLNQALFIHQFKNKTVGIVLQDMLTDGGKHSAEYVAMVNVFRESFEVVGK